MFYELDKNKNDQTINKLRKNDDITSKIKNTVNQI